MCVFEGPGPGRYGLPPTVGFIGHDFTKPTSPAYSFHGKMTDNSKFLSTLLSTMIINHRLDSSLPFLGLGSGACYTL